MHPPPAAISPVTWTRMTRKWEEHTQVTKDRHVVGTINQSLQTEVGELIVGQFPRSRQNDVPRLNYQILARSTPLAEDNGLNGLYNAATSAGLYS